MKEQVMLDLAFRRSGAELGSFKGKKKYAARQVFIKVRGDGDVVNKDRCFDLVVYDTLSRTFRLVELKAGHTPATIRNAFQQVEKYRRIMKGRELAFLDAFTRRSPMRFSRLMEATADVTRIIVAFYVGLTDQACHTNLSLLHLLKHKYPDTGIMRVKNDGRLKNYVKGANGKRDYDLTKARSVCFTLTRSPGWDTTKRKNSI